MREPERGDILSALQTFYPSIHRIQTQANLDSASLLWALGWTGGHALAKQMKASSIPELIVELSAISQKMQLGSVSVRGGEPLVIEFRQCLGCRQSMRQSRCPIWEGALKAIMDDLLETACTVKHQSTVVDEGEGKRCAFAVSVEGTLPATPVQGG